MEHNHIIPVESPIGRLHLQIASGKLWRINLPNEQVGQCSDNPPPAVTVAAEQVKSLLADYFSGREPDRQLLIKLVEQLPEKLPDNQTVSSFHRRVWKTLTAVPRGEVVSYRFLGVMTGFPKAARAVGSAMSHNPLPILVPCHRVVRSDGSIGDYGGGVELKRQLHRFEGREVK